MLPILFSIGPVTIYSLAFFLAAGFLTSSFILWRRLKDLGLKEEKILDLVVVMTLVSLLMARIFFVLQNLRYFGLFTSRWFLPGRYPGFSFWGTLIGIFLSLTWFIKKEKWDFWQVSDEVSLSLLPFLIAAQFGSFLDGSSLGKPTSLAWGLFFPGELLRRQPTSLLTAFTLFFIWLFLRWAERKWRMWEWYKSKANGFIALSFFGLFSLVNFVIAFWHDSRLYFYWLEIFLSGIFAIIALIIFYFRSGGKIYGRDKISLKNH